MQYVKMRLRFITRQTHSLMCTVSGPILEKLKISEQVHLSIHTKLHDGTPTMKPVQITTKLKSLASGTSDHIEAKQKDDVYSMQFTPLVRGCHKLDIQVNHKAIAGSPFPMFVTVPATELGTPVMIIDGLREPQGVAINSNTTM